MRMRKLGHGQSVIFCVPQEIKTKIEGLRSKGGAVSDEIQVSEILIWSISETFASLQRGIQLWATQGRRHEKHHSLWKKFTGGERALTADGAKGFLKDEAQTILQRYGPNTPNTQQNTRPTLEPGGPDLILGRLRDFGIATCDAATLHEEQERELTPEIETEREQELPPPTVPAAHTLHPDIKRFVADGVILASSQAYVRAFALLKDTRAAEMFGTSNIPKSFMPGLLVSTDFARTVKPPSVGKPQFGSYLRSVQWVLVGRGLAGSPF